MKFSASVAMEGASSHRCEAAVLSSDQPIENVELRRTNQGRAKAKRKLASSDDGSRSRNAGGL
jgi:hypothetical protein